MALETEFKELASTTITIAPLSAHTAYGAPTFGTESTFEAQVEEDIRLIRKSDGQEVMTKFWVAVMSSSASISVHDQIQAAGSTELSIASVLTLNDDEGQHHIELLLS